MFLILSVISNAQDVDIWIVSNLKMTKSDKELDVILNSPRYSKEDILIYHGNALKKTDKEVINSRIKDLRSKFERVYIIPGASDWDNLKSKNLKSLGDFLDDEFKGDVIVPENSCGNLEIKEIGEDLAMVFMDSDWYFNDWTDDRNINKSCEVTSRFAFWEEVTGTIGKLKAKQILLFARTPVMRNDKFGGHLTWKEHLLPLPILGTMINDTKNYLTPRKSTISPIYQDYISEMEALLENHPKLTLITSDAKINTIYNIENNFQINVNTSKKSSQNHEDLDLIYTSQSPSILHLQVAKEEVVANLISASQGTIDFSQPILEGTPFTYDSTEFENFDLSSLDSKVKRRIRLDKDMIKLNSFFFGGLNKDLYIKEVEVEQLNLKTTKGGLKPLRLGGGKQTNSLRLIDSSGQVYLARSLKKRPKKTLPANLDIKPIEKTVGYYFMAADPLAFLTTPVLDKAANLYYITPQLKYLSRQPALAEYNDEIGDELVIFRERADEAWPNKESFGYSENIISSTDMIEELANNDAEVDANMFLRARLLDLVIGDWDRHKDQWRWAQGRGDKSDTYFPIARDRDQVYANFDGLALAMVRAYVVDILQMRKFDDNLNKDDIQWMHWKSAILDNYVLIDLNEEDWERETAFIKNAITDDVIRKATDQLPSGYEEQKQNIENNVKARMKAIDQISEDFRSKIMEKAIVRASNKKDSIVIIQSENETEILIFTDYLDEDDKGLRTYNFNKEETCEVWLYGLEKDDIYIMTGNNNSDIHIKLIGGYGDDQFLSSRKFKNILIIDDEPKANVSSTTQTNYKFVEDKLVHDLTRHDLVPLHKFFMPQLAYNTDDGFLVGGSYTWNKTGFKTKISQSISASYLTERQSSLLSYNYRKDDLITQRSTYFSADWSGVRRQLNFYGGNGSRNLGDNDFYEVWLSDARLEFGKIKHLNRVASISTGLYGWSAKVADDQDQLITQASFIDPRIFDREYFMGVKTGIVLQNSDDAIRPTKLARLSLSLNYKYATQADRSNILFDFEYDYYRPLIGEDRLLFSTRLKGGHLFGDYFIYEGYQIGGSDFLRGYRNGRFTGRTVIAQNTNLQLKMFNRLFGENFKCSAGISGGFDHGRTWSDYDENEKWQYSYGGGLWISPLDLAVFSAGIYQSNNTDERYQIRIKFGWQF